MTVRGLSGDCPCAVVASEGPMDRPWALFSEGPFGVCSFGSLHFQKFAASTVLQLRRFAASKVCIFESLQLRKFAASQIAASKVSIFESLQLRKFAFSKVSSFESQHFRKFAASKISIFDSKVSIFESLHFRKLQPRKFAASKVCSLQLADINVQLAASRPETSGELASSWLRLADN